MNAKILKYGKAANGAVTLRVEISERCEVQVRPSTTDDQSYADDLAEKIASMVDSLRIAGDRVQAAHERATREKGLRMEAEKELENVLGRRSVNVPDCFAREQANGDVWLGSEHKHTEHFSLWFKSWAELRIMHPSLAPAGMIIDPDGKPAIRMRVLPAVSKEGK